MFRHKDLCFEDAAIRDPSLYIAQMRAREITPYLDPTRQLPSSTAPLSATLLITTGGSTEQPGQDQSCCLQASAGTGYIAGSGTHRNRFGLCSLPGLSSWRNNQVRGQAKPSSMWSYWHGRGLHGRMSPRPQATQTRS